jgi:hypothetical protein
MIFFSFELANGMKMQGKSYELLIVSMLARILESSQDIVVYVDNLDIRYEEKTQLAFWWIG